MLEGGEEKISGSLSELENIGSKAALQINVSMLWTCFHHVSSCSGHTDHIIA